MIIKKKLNKTKKETVDYPTMKQTKIVKSKISFQTKNHKVNLTQIINLSNLKMPIKKTKLKTKILISKLNSIKMSHLSLNQMTRDNRMWNHRVANSNRQYSQMNKTYKI